jgi:hypothetical protein
MMARMAVCLVAFLLVGVWPDTVGAQGTGSLEAGIRAYLDRGDPRETIRQIGPALDAGAVPTTSRPRAHLYMAHAFLALGDSESAVPHIESALAAEPCLLPAPDLTPPAWGEMWERYRPPGASCGPRVVTAALQSAVIPGWGQRSLGRAGASNYFLGSIGLAAGGAVLSHRRADNHYQSYQRSSDFEEVAGLYSSAEDWRRYAVLFGTSAAAIYVWNIVDAARSGAAHDRELATVRPLAIVPVIAPTQTGTILAFQVRLR